MVCGRRMWVLLCPFENVDTETQTAEVAAQERCVNMCTTGIQEFPVPGFDLQSRVRGAPAVPHKLLSARWCSGRRGAPCVGQRRPEPAPLLGRPVYLLVW